MSWSTWNVAQTSIAAISALICLITLVLFTGEYRFIKKPIKTPVLLTSLFSILSFTICSCLFVYTSVQYRYYQDTTFESNIDDHDIDIKIWRLLQSIWEILWNIGIILYFILYLVRFYLTFNSTTHYRPSKYVYLILLSMIFIYFLFTCVLGVRTYFRIEYPTNDIQQKLYFIYSIGASPLAFIISVTMLLLFLRKLSKISSNIGSSYALSSNNTTAVSIEMTSSMSKKESHTQNQNDINYHLMPDDDFKTVHSVTKSKTKNNITRNKCATIESQQGCTITIVNRNTVFDEMAKLVMLINMVIITTQFVLITVLVGSILGAFLHNAWNDKDHNLLRNIYYLTRNLNCMVICVCIFLSFKINHKMYKCCCNCCHNRVSKIFQSNMVMYSIDDELTKSSVQVIENLNKQT